MEQPKAGKAGQRQNLFERNPRKTLVFTAAFLILCVDVAARVFFDPTGHSFRGSSPYYHHDFLPNQEAETLWGDRKYRIFTNSLGFRDRTIRDVAPDSKQKRILLIGDSFIEGMGVDYQDSVAGILGEALKADTTEVLNAAAVSYSPKLYYLKTRYLIERKHLRFDEVYVFLDISDPHDEIIYKYWEPTDGNAFASGMRALDGFFQARSFFYSYIAARRRLNRQKAISNIFPAEGSAESQFWVQDLKEYLRRADPEKDRFLWPNKQSALEEWGKEGLSRCGEYLAKLQELCLRRNIRMTLVIYPSPYQLTGSNLNGVPVFFWQSFTKEHQMGLLNLFPVFIGGRPPEKVYATYFIKGDIHWNEEGNRLVAESVLGHIREKSR